MKNSLSKTAAYIPQNFSLEQHVIHYDPIGYNINEYTTNPTRFRDYALFLLSQISEVMASDKRTYEEQEEGFVPLYSGRLEEYVKPYANYLRYFIDTGVIERDDYYIQKRYDPEGKGKSYGYRFTPYFKQSPLIKVNYSEEFAERLFKLQKKTIDRYFLRYGHLTKWLFPVCNLRIEEEQAKQYAQLRLEALIANPDLIEYKKNKRGKLVPKDPYSQYKSLIYNVDKIASGQLPCIVDHRVHRLFSPLTSLKREFRNLISFEQNGRRQPLITFDIRNCQPYLASILLDVYNPQRLRTISSKCGYEPTKPVLEKLCQLYENEHFGFDDIWLYKSLVSNTDGNSMDLYDYMLDQCKVHGIDLKTRDEVKEGMYGVIFGDYEYDSPVKSLFATLFPFVNEIFKEIKKNNKEDLPCLLQSIIVYPILCTTTWPNEMVS